MVMDVMSAADPQRLATAEQRLQGLRTAGMPAATAAPDAYQKFEAFLLRSSFEEMLPPASSGAFGEGFAGGVWRSMAADQFASLFADHGGIGIASALRSGAHGRNAATAAASDPTPAPQWLYFQTPSIASFAA